MQRTREEHTNDLHPHYHRPFLNAVRPREASQGPGDRRRYAVGRTQCIWWVHDPRGDVALAHGRRASCRFARRGGVLFAALTDLAVTYFVRAPALAGDCGWAAPALPAHSLRRCQRCPLTGLWDSGCRGNAWIDSEDGGI